MNYDAMDEYQKNIDEMFEDEDISEEAYEQAMYENYIENQVIY